MKQLTKLKEAGMGMVPEDWEETIFSEAVEVNPKRDLKKGGISKYISMSDLKEFDKKIPTFATRKFSGGAKFVNGDTLMARITPCLENGKTAYVDVLEEGEVGAGSTEFIVLAGKEGRTISQFVYYLATSPDIKIRAIKSMTGTSGRQRVENNVFDKIIVNLPSVSEQSAIAKILEDLDSKIELNRQMNKTLEATAQALFKRWFVNFEFPNDKGKPYKLSDGEMVDSELGEIPKEWSVGNFGDIVDNFDSKRIPISSRERASKQGVYPYYGATSIMDYINDYIFDGIYVLMGEDGTVISDDGYPILQYIWGKFWVNNHAHVLVGKGNISTEFLFLFLKQTNVAHIVTGAVQPKINQANMNSLPVVIPPEYILNQFSKFITNVFAQYRTNREEINSLSQIRDSLLPRLMSGKIRVAAKGGDNHGE